MPTASSESICRSASRHAITWFWLRYREAPLNERQRKALNLALSGSELDDGWLTNRRYLKLSGANAPLTALRDLAHLEQLGVIRRDSSADYTRAGPHLWRIYRFSDLA